MTDPVQPDSDREVTDAMVEAAQQAFHDFTIGPGVSLTHREKGITRFAYREAIAAALAVRSQQEAPGDDGVGWYEFRMPGGSTTHVGYAYEDGSVYLPEGPSVVTESDFRVASATNSFWRLVRLPVDDKTQEA